MKKFELYLDNDERLVLSEFKTVDSEYESRIFRGRATYELIRRLASSKLVDFSKVRHGNDLILEYKNYAINISDYADVFRKKGISPLLKNIKDFEERPIIRENKNKKVKRKNKYVGRKIVATGLTLLIIGCCAQGLLNKANKPDQQSTLDNNFETIINVDEKNNPKIIDIEKIEEISEKINIEPDIISITLEYPDWSKAPKANIVKAYYGDMISKYAKMYGIDPKLAIAVATQETDNGIHRSTIDPGGATGIMQIQNDVWLGNYVTAYNFETKKVESLKVTDSNIGELESNIKMGCMILQNAMEYMNHNILAGIQCYNMGSGNLDDILDAYSKYTGKSRKVILSDVTDTGWMEFRKIKNVGEQRYVEKVFSWMGEDNTIKNVKRDGTLVSINVGNQIESKKMY